jgi:hypothetical protein
VLCGRAIVEQSVSSVLTIMANRQSDEAIAGHLFCSFLALVLRKELDERLATAGLDLEWADAVRDLDRIEEVTVDQVPTDCGRTA